MLKSCQLFHKTLHHRCLAGSWIRLWMGLRNLNMHIPWSLTYTFADFIVYLKILLTITLKILKIDEFNFVTFLEKLTILLKKEPQSVHWSGVEIIVHSGILRKDSNKEYHCYLSDDLIQNHAFSNLILDEMLQDINHGQKRDEASWRGVLRKEVWLWQSLNNT